MSRREVLRRMALQAAGWMLWRVAVGALAVLRPVPAAPLRMPQTYPGGAAG